jgi:hypothetical protein
MKYRDIEYTVVQGIERQVWKWSVSVADVVVRGQAATRSEAVTNAERAIDRALAPKKLRVVPPDIPRGKYIGEAVDSPKDEAACGAWIDCRDLGMVFDHEGPLPHPDRQQ